MINAEDNKRIAKNTIMLYIRMFFVMVVNLYATRVVLSVLGEEDFGIYNVVGGIVILFSFLSAVLASASQRFFAFELGRKNKVKLSQLFDITLILYVIITIVIVILTELLGMWFLNYKATIPLERMAAAHWVFQFSILSFVLSLMATPYQAIIIANEKMDVYAVIGIIEALLQLFMALALQYIPFNTDYLILYGLFILGKAFIANGSYVGYSLSRYEESYYKHYWNKTLAKEILSYSGWNMFGAIAGVARSQGINMLINVFFNPAINAARGVAYQVNNAINQFANNFYTAVRPQVTKNYAQGDMEATISLVFSSSKLTYFLLLFVAVPIMVFAEPILNLWLDVVPSHTLLFTELVIIIALIDSLSNPLMTLALATGKIRLYQSVVGSLLILNLPVSWIVLRLGYSAEATMIVAIVISIISLFARLIILRNIASFPVRKYLFQVLPSISISTIMSFGVVSLLKVIFPPNNETIVLLFVKLSIAVLLTLVLIFMTGLSKREKEMLVGIIRNRLQLISKLANRTNGTL